MTDARDFEAMMLRVNARRVAAIFCATGGAIPPGAAAVLDDDSEEQWYRDNTDYADWCERRGLEVVMFKGGVFRMLGDGGGGPGRVLGQAH